MNAPIAITKLLTTALILFCGSGGLSKGFEDAGMETTGIDYDPRACQDHTALTGRPAICADIGAMQPDDLRALYPECPDVLATSAPCVGFSGCLPEATSKTLKYVEFNNLALHGIALALEAWKGATVGRKVPGVILLENVPRIQSRGKQLLEYMLALLHAEGYAVDMSTHCCGELGKRVAQKRRRFLMIARHMPTVMDFIRKPPQYKPLAIREVLWQLAPPRPGGKGMHALPSLSALNHLRLACIPAGGDWRNLPPEVHLYPCESGELETVTGIRWEHCEGRHAGKLGVLDWTLPSKTIIGKARVCNTWNAVADPRVGWDPDLHGGRPDSYGVADPAAPSPTVRGKQLVQNSKASIPDPRVGVGLPTSKKRQNGGFGVENGAAPSHAVIAEGTVRNTRASVADPRLTCEPRKGAYGVTAGEDPSATIVGHHAHDNGPASVADPRLSHAPRRGSNGVQAASEPSDTIRGMHSVRQAPGSVQDPRVAKKAKPAKHHVEPIRYDERGWPVATHELVRLDDGRLVLYGPAVDFKSRRPRADIVIRAPDGTLHRPMTDLELAVLMGFPVDFEFCGPSSCSKTADGEQPKTGRRKRIGNAVPPPTAEAIGREVMATLIASANGGFRLASGSVWVAPEASMAA